MQPASGPGVICKVCLKQFANYTCPRCNLRYCSVPCYKQHSTRCTEEFYRESAVAELKNTVASDEQKAEMEAILRRLHEQDLCGSSDESSSGDEFGEGEGEGEGGELCERTLALLLQRQEQAGGELEVDPELLTHDELAAFEAAVARGEVALPEGAQDWQPWWRTQAAAAVRLSASGTALVRHAAAPGMPAPAASGPPAAPGEPLPPLRSLTKAAPSPLLRWQLAEVLYAYCLTTWLYLGDWRDDPPGAAHTMLHVSAALGQGAAAQPPESMSSALLAALAAALQPQLLGAAPRGFAVAVVRDVGALLGLGRSCVLLALTDAVRLAAAARTELLAKGGGAGNAGGGGRQAPGGGAAVRGLVAEGRRLQAAERKLAFLLAWANEQPADMYHALSLEAEEEAARQAAMLPEQPVPGLVSAVGAAAAEGLQQGKRPAIEEL